VTKSKQFRDPLSGLPWSDKNVSITKDGLALHIFRIFFCGNIFKIMQDEINLYATQQVKKEQDGLLKKKSAFVHWKHVTIQELKVLCAVAIHTCCVSAM
jgi:hypothetical protein